MTFTRNKFFSYFFENTCTKFSWHAASKANWIPHWPCWQDRYSILTISQLHFQVLGIKRQSMVASAFESSYWINCSGGTQTTALCGSKSLLIQGILLGALGGPWLVKHSWVQARIKAKVSFDGKSHFSVQHSAVWELEGKCIVARASHSAWVEKNTSLIYHKRLSRKSRALRGWMNKPYRDNPAASLFSQYKKIIN